MRRKCLTGYVVLIMYNLFFNLLYFGKDHTKLRSMLTKDIKYVQGLLLNWNVINVVLFFQSSLLLNLSTKP